MTTITFHLPSLLVGAGIGVIAGCVLLFLSMFGERWSVGFSNGFDCGKEYGERKGKE